MLSPVLTFRHRYTHTLESISKVMASKIATFYKRTHLLQDLAVVVTLGCGITGIQYSDSDRSRHSSPATTTTVRPIISSL